MEKRKKVTLENETVRIACLKDFKDAEFMVWEGGKLFNYLIVLR